MLKVGDLVFQSSDLHEQLVALQGHSNTFVRLGIDSDLKPLDVLQGTIELRLGEAQAPSGPQLPAHLDSPASEVEDGGE